MKEVVVTPPVTRREEVGRVAMKLIICLGD